MTKARDLANASTALSAVSATELGYVDGVTSAIQTQMDAKAPSSTAATLTGTQTLTNKTIDTASNTITGAVTLTGTQTLTNKTLTSPALTTPTISTATTNGDILYGTGSGALARLGIGSSAQVLTVASGVPSWATPAGSSYTWSAYTPTLTNLTIGNGSANFYYVEIGNLVVVIWEIVWGSTTSLSGVPMFTSPVTPANQGLEGTYGSAVFRDSGTDAYVGHVAFDSPRFYLYTGEIRNGYTAPKNLSSTVPFTHTTNDAWRGYFIVKKA